MSFARFMVIQVSITSGVNTSPASRNSWSASIAEIASPSEPGTVSMAAFRSSCRLDERPELEIDLGLTGRGHLVVLHLDRDAGVDQRQHDLRAHVLRAIDRRHREVAFLVARPMPQLRAAAVPPPNCTPFLGIDVVVAH